MAVKGKKAETPSAAPRSKKPKQEDLPGMEDRKIPELESAALTYVEGRDERMEMTKREVELKALLLGLMKKHSKTTYKCGDIEIRVVPKDETVKVRIAKEKEESSDDIEIE